jgi:hypothetical protein
MRTIFYIVFLFLFSITILGQNIPENSMLSTDSDTSYWMRYQSNILRNVKQAKPFHNADNFHFRLIYQGQLVSNLIDLWQIKDSIYHLELIFYTREIVPDGETQTNRYYSEKITFDSIKAKDLYIIYSSKQINSIPTDKKIKNWSMGFDGDEYIFETLENGNYTFKQYWTPSSQDSLLEGSLITNFIKLTSDLLEIGKLKEDFSARIPFECYNSGGPLTSCKILTKKQKREYIKERKNYRQQRV